MLHDLLVFAPFFMSLFWTIIHSIVSYRTDYYPIYAMLLVEATLFFMVDGYYSSLYGTPELYIWFTLLYQLVAPSFIPIAVLAFKHMDDGEPFKPRQFLWVAIPAGMFAATGLLMTIIGNDQLVNFVSVVNAHGLGELKQFEGMPVHSYFIWSNIILRSIIGIEMLYFLVMVVVIFSRKHYSIGQYFRFFFKGEKADVLLVQLVPAAVIAVVYLFKMFLFKSYLDEHLSLTALLSIFTTAMVFMIDFSALFQSKGSMRLAESANVTNYNYGKEDRVQIIEEIVGDLIDGADAELSRRIRARIGITPEVEAWEKGDSGETSIAERIFSAASGSWDDDSLMGGFQRLMLDEQLFLKPGLTLGEIADRLESNKTYISKMVNNTYNLGFPELLNILRVDYAQKYILEHRDAKQEQVALDCGFFSASSFNTVFRKITGTTPKVWAASQEKKAPGPGQGLHV